MKAIILAAGKGERMKPLTLECPKPLLPVAGKSIIDYVFESLPDSIDEVIIPVLYLADKIKKHCGEEFYGRKVHYVEGSELGSAYSFLAAKDFIEPNERFLFINGDEIPNPEDVEKCLSYPASVLCWEVEDPWNHGVAILNDDGSIKEIVEKPEHPKSSLISNGVLVLDGSIFEYTPEKTKGEFYFTTMLNNFIKKRHTTAVISNNAIGGVSTPADIERVEKWLKNK